MATVAREDKRSKADVTVLLTLSEQDRELLDELTARLDVSETEVVIRALHLCKALQNRAQGYL